MHPYGFLKIVAGPLFLSLLCCIFPFTIKAGESTRLEYLQLVNRFPLLLPAQGDAAKGEIQVVLDPQKMAMIEKSSGREVGVVMQDKYWLWVNDACIFPSGHEGVYGRILWVNSLTSCPGVAVMPILPNGKVALNCNFRHATRSWEIELPRGGVNVGETVEAAAKREAFEETGLVVDDLFLLGELATDTGLTGTIVPIYAAKVLEQQDSHQEASEAIEKIVFLSMAEIKQAFLQGTYTCMIRGEEKQIPFRDAFLAYAILQYELASLRNDGTPTPPKKMMNP